jgi:hypothetical protein
MKRRSRLRQSLCLLASSPPALDRSSRRAVQAPLNRLAAQARSNRPAQAQSNRPVQVPSSLPLLAMLVLCLLPRPSLLRPKVLRLRR